jgi:hypothetical protein
MHAVGFLGYYQLQTKRIYNFFITKPKKLFLEFIEFLELFETYTTIRVEN